MFTSVGNAHIPSAPTADFQRYDTIRLRQINHIMSSENDVKYWLSVPARFLSKKVILLSDSLVLEESISAMTLNYCHLLL